MSNKRNIFSIVVTFIISTFFLAIGVVSADQGMADGDTVRAVSLVEDYPVKPSFIIERADHVANGIAMEGRTSGTIHLRGVPAEARILHALLYFNFSNDKVIGDPTRAVLFNGNNVIGNKVSDSADPCWSFAGNHTYRADVTAFVPAAAPNQDYVSTIQFDVGNPPTNGQNPWAGGRNGVKGATLVVVYSGSGTVYIYDALNGTMFASTASFNLFTPGNFVRSGLFTMTGADGQRGGGHDNSVSNEQTFFNGSQLAGVGAAGLGKNGNTASDWDGSAGWPLPQLWDVHTHIAPLLPDPNPQVVKYVASGDCLVPSAFVIDN